jgi:hypothetical protein
MYKTLVVFTLALSTLFAQGSPIGDIPNVSANPAIAATNINDLLVASADTKYTGMYNGMSAAEATLALGYAKISVEQSELELYRANSRLNDAFDFLKSVAVKARASKNPAWDKLITEEYFKVLQLELQRSEMAMMAYKKVIEVSETFDQLAANVKKEEAVNWKKSNQPGFDSWLKVFDGLQNIKLAADHDPILREAASHISESRVRNFHVAMYDIKPGVKVVTCYPIRGCSEPMPVR